MNVQFNWGTDVLTTLVLDTEILPNHYEIQVDMITNTTNQSDQLQCFAKIKFFLSEWLSHACFVESGTQSFEIISKNFDQRIVELPGPASDLIIGAVLFRKIYAIIDNLVILDNLSIRSKLGSGVMYNINNQDNFEELKQLDHSTEHWWDRPDLSTNSLDESLLQWSDLEMETTKDKANKQKFNPTIITGGKHEHQ